MIKIWTRLTAITLLALTTNLQAQLFSDEPELLKASEAFPALITADNGQVKVNFTVADTYYLYKHAFKLSADKGVQLGELNIPAGKKKIDDYFGEVETYRQSVTISAPITHIPDGVEDFTLSAKSQGCADLGVCYPPYTQTQLLLANEASTISSSDSESFIEDPADFQPIVEPLDETENTLTPERVSEQQALANQLASGKTVITLLLFFLFGLLLAFTPCVFPMIPILAGIIVGQKEQLTTRKAFTLSIIYVLAMAVTYTVAGVIVGLSGENVQVVFQTPWVLYSFAVIFVLLSLSMFGVYELQMPGFIQNKLSQISNTQKGGTYIGAAIMGLLSALIVGPCVTAPLIGALLYIAQTGDAVLGGMALFSLSLGMGAPLLLIGTTAGKWLPKAGGWMDAVKGFFGVMLLGVAIWLLDRILSPQIILLLVALLAIGTAVFMGALQFTNDRHTGLAKLKQLISVLLLAYGVLALIGALSGGKNLLEPLKHFAGGSSGAAVQEHALPFKQVKGLDGLKQAIADAKGKHIMLDFYADWCVSCKEMEAFTFPKENVQTALKDFVLLQADVTLNDDLDKALLSELGLVGPPAILFYDASGDEKRPYRVVGYVKADKFAEHIGQFVTAH